MTLDEIMSLADRCYSRFDAEPQWKLRQAIEHAMLQAHKAGFDAALLPGSVPDHHDKSDADPRVELLALKIRAMEAEAELKRRNQSASDRLHNICRAIEKEADGSEFSREEWNRLDAENSTLHAEIRELKKGTI